MSKAANYQLEHTLGDQFTRFQVALREASEAMDDASPTNLEGLEADARTLIESHQEEFDSVCERLSSA